jgi:hypothetical protein
MMRQVNQAPSQKRSRAMCLSVSVFVPTTTLGERPPGITANGLSIAAKASSPTAGKKQAIISMVRNDWIFHSAPYL